METFYTGYDVQRPWCLNPNEPVNIPSLKNYVREKIQKIHDASIERSKKKYK